MFKRLTPAALVFSGWMMGTAIAAPFCLTLPGGGSQCMYYDGASCARDANRATGATCGPNPDEIQLSRVANSNYCVVTAQGASVCGYSDQNTCSREAVFQHGACIKGGATPGPQQLPNDYDPNAGR